MRHTHTRHRPSNHARQHRESRVRTRERGNLQPSDATSRIDAVLASDRQRHEHHFKPVKINGEPNGAEACRCGVYRKVQR